MEKHMINTNLVLNTIYKKSPLQRKKIEKFLNSKDESFKQEFENFLTDYISSINPFYFLIHYYALDERISSASLALVGR